jgi:ribosomal protein S8E
VKARSKTIYSTPRNGSLTTSKEASFRSRHKVEGDKSQTFRNIKREQERVQSINTVGKQLSVRLNPPTNPGTANPVDHFATSIKDLFQHALQGSADGDMVGVDIHNDVNQNDRAVGISFRRRDQLSADVIWSVFERVAPSNARFNYLDALTIVVHRVGTPVGF